MISCTLFTEAGTHEAKEVLDRGSDSGAVLRAFLKKARKDRIKVVQDDITVRMGIRRGATKGAKKSKVRMSKMELETEMPKVIREISRLEQEPTRDRVAKKLGLSNAKALDRLRYTYEDRRPWLDVVTGAVCRK